MSLKRPLSLWKRAFCVFFSRKVFRVGPAICISSALSGIGCNAVACVRGMAIFVWMVPKNRIGLHVFFWLIYFGITFFNELYLTSDFAGNVSLAHVAFILPCEILLFAIKVLLVYYVLYAYLPRWAKAPDKTKLVLEGLGVLFVTLLVYRGIKVVFREEPPDPTIQSIIARFLYSFLEILQIVAIAATIKLFRVRIAAMQKEKELEREKMMAELGHLKAQINPHFLFNMLNSIFSLSRMQSERTSDVVLRLSSLLRFMLYESGKVTVPIEDEIKIIRDYIDMQQLRFEGRVNISQTFDVDNPGTAITPLLLFPFFENAFKHGVGSKADHSFIDVVLRLHEGRLHLKMRNSVVKESLNDSDSHGIGLANIRKQLRLLYKEYDLHTHEVDQVFEADLAINLHSYAGLELYHS